MPRLINEFQQFFDGSGEPLANGLLYFYESGSSSVAKETYLDSAESIANSNPVKLNGDGRCPNVFGSGIYNVILRTSSGEQIQARDPVGGSSTLGFGSAWDAQTVYSLSFVVFYTGKYWQSLVSSNIDNIPTEGAIWTEVDLTQIAKNKTDIIPIKEQGIRFYTSDVNYVVNARVIGSDGNIYKCLIPNGASTTVVDPVGDLTGTWKIENPQRSWVNYTTPTERALSTTYFAPDDRDIHVAIYCSASTGSASFGVGGQTVYVVPSNTFNTISIPVPAGASYILNGASTLIGWREFR